MSRWWILVLGAFLCGCGEDEEVGRKGLGFEEFVPKYNQYIRNWLQTQKVEAEKGVAEARA
ncbi:MAG: hypothetical protein HKO57_12235, partial [Akkermansiaceae bacterium]|nr:hypothetical protein [Akkermansiaceae bacterium]